MRYHMPSNITASRKAFSTHITFKRFFFRVRPHVVHEPIGISKILSANRTQIRLLTAVRSKVQLQVVQRDKLFFANVAFVVFFPRVDSGVARETRLGIEAFSTYGAEKLPF